MRFQAPAHFIETLTVTSIILIILFWSKLIGLWSMMMVTCDLSAKVGRLWFGLLSEPLEVSSSNSTQIWHKRPYLPTWIITISNISIGPTVPIGSGELILDNSLRTTAGNRLISKVKFGRYLYSLHLKEIFVYQLPEWYIIFIIRLTKDENKILLC